MKRPRFSTLTRLFSNGNSQRRRDRDTRAVEGRRHETHLSFSTLADVLGSGRLEETDVSATRRANGKKRRSSGVGGNLFRFGSKSSLYEASPDESGGDFSGESYPNLSSGNAAEMSWDFEEGNGGKAPLPPKARTSSNRMASATFWDAPVTSPSQVHGTTLSLAPILGQTPPTNAVIATGNAGVGAVAATPPTPATPGIGTPGATNHPVLNIPGTNIASGQKNASSGLNNTSGLIATPASNATPNSWTRRIVDMDGKGVLEVGKSCSVAANLVDWSSTVVVSGELRGTISVAKLVVEPGGRLLGVVDCDEIVIHGEMDACLTSRKFVLVGGTARVQGELTYNVMEMQKGAMMLCTITCQHMQSAASDNSPVRVSFKDLPAINDDEVSSFMEDDSISELTEVSTSQGGVGRGNSTRFSQGSTSSRSTISSRSTTSSRSTISSTTSSTRRSRRLSTFAPFDGPGTLDESEEETSDESEETGLLADLSDPQDSDPVNTSNGSSSLGSGEQRHRAANLTPPKVGQRHGGVGSGVRSSRRGFLDRQQSVVTSSGSIFPCGEGEGEGEGEGGVCSHVFKTPTDGLGAVPYAPGGKSVHASAQRKWAGSRRGRAGSAPSKRAMFSRSNRTGRHSFSTSFSSCFSGGDCSASSSESGFGTATLSLSPEPDEGVGDSAVGIEKRMVEEEKKEERRAPFHNEGSQFIISVESDPFEANTKAPLPGDGLGESGSKGRSVLGRATRFFRK